MGNRNIIWVLLVCSFWCTSVPFVAVAQSDTSILERKTSNWLNKLRSSVTRHNVSKRDTGSTVNLTMERNQIRFSPYQGKVIRHIYIHQLNFYQSMDDTATSRKYFGTQVLTKLHRTTRTAVIRNNLFIREGEPFYATVIADNERYLRTVPFLRDARFVMDSITGGDSVDIHLYTKDLFSITGNIGSLSSNRARLSAAEVNLGGLGQSVLYTGYYERGRRPGYDGELGYQYNNVMGSFANIRAFATDIGKNLITGDRNEQMNYLEISRPMVSQYKRFMGGLSISEARTRNLYPQLDSDGRYFEYKYTSFDVWSGWNLGVKKYITDEKNHLRKFLAFRYVKYTFHNSPDQIVAPFDMKTNSREMALAQFTLFRQDFFQTRYFYGFGTVEDIPYGFSYNLTAGWYRQRRVSRPYLGVDLNNYMLTKNGDIFQFFLKGGTFLNHGQLEDAGYTAGSTFYGRVLYWGNTRVRQVFRASYSEVFKNVTTYPLQINNEKFGLKNFSSDSTIGSRRLSLHSESRFFTPYKLFGFLLAPFMSWDLSLLTPMTGNMERTALYSGVGPGLRIRNENLVFGTIELRSLYFPKNVPGENRFKIGLTANLRFRFNTNYVNKPDLYDLNNDVNQTIY